MTQAHGVEQAFQSLEDAPPVLRGLLRPVLVRALQDAALMRQLASGDLSQHLALLGQVLETTAGPGSSALPLPKTFLHLAIGEDVEDIEQAYRLTQSLEPPLRARVEGGLSRAFQIAADRSEYRGVGLLALARLLALAFSNLPFVEHVLGGGSIEPFLPPAGAKKAPSKSRAKSKPKPARKGSAQTSRATAGSSDEGAVSPDPASLVGRLVEVVAVVREAESSEAGRVFVAIGRVLEVSPGHVLLETLRDGERPGSRLLLGMADIVALRALSSDSLPLAFEAG